jgi:hypothetical protein
MPWPSGRHDLIIGRGERKQIDAGSILDFRNIRIDGELFIGSSQRTYTPSWTIIGCTGDLICNGRIVGNRAVYGISGPIGTTAPDGHPLSINYLVSQGGNGGNAHRNDGYALGGARSNGNGGGGAAPFLYGFDATMEQGGSGGALAPPGTKWRCADGGPGGTFGEYPTNQGFAGGSINDNLTQGGAIGGGGGGGARGYHGELLYLRILGTFGKDAGPGGTIATFDFHASNGGPGGDGGSAFAPFDNDIRAGGGGGGGAGGNGGHIIIRCRKRATGNVLLDWGLTGGKGGSGGAAGQVSRPPKVGTQATAGEAGQDGADGIYDLVEVF